MLCIAEGISRSTLDASLHEGPLAREPNRYTNYQTYSIVSTTTPMPPKGQSAGFKQRNAIVGNAWSSYSDDEKDVFSPRLFERLIQALMQEADPLLAPEPTSTSPIEADADELTDEDKAQYLPLFKNLVNMQNVKRDFKNGQLCRHSGTPNRVEKVGIEEIKKVVEQFHLLVSAWHPNTTMTRALYQDEFTSCERWAVHARSEFHLLERFALESTQAPPNTKKKNKKTDSATATHQDCLRKELTTCLNGLVLYIQLAAIQLVFKYSALSVKDYIVEEGIHHLSQVNEELSPEQRFTLAIIRETTYASLTDILYSTPTNHKKLESEDSTDGESSKSYFAALCLALLESDVSINRIDTEEETVEFQIKYCPNQSKRLMFELIRMGSPTQHLMNEDTRITIIKASHDSPNQNELTKIEQLKLELELSTYPIEPESDVRIASNVINTLGLKISQIEAFRKREAQLFEILVPTLANRNHS
ncbi:uncharacterized protein MELLADRAFT_104169 [Melampsora larici-populina 98AG31]|uniref:Uncharacterized protein n=1 Tax=Melampsora larici-populina (strain 98AG31 / pathotype 3-4-7) TaxID=747676 RepID=F4RDT3_MELLP|nr:uncharacterized protein MELLADRAFT_104169 [Melampsora larici-populina 98AG31]EGG09554.1 hypothetical protein MELLADRAFT_104169 [Melampsora larici-populina 98AG31]